MTKVEWVSHKLLSFELTCDPTYNYSQSSFSFISLPAGPLRSRRWKRAIRVAVGSVDLLVFPFAVDVGTEVYGIADPDAECRYLEVQLGHTTSFHDDFTHGFGASDVPFDNVGNKSQDIA